MTILILKTTVPVDDEWHEIPGGPVVHVADQDGKVTVWFEEDSDAEQGTRTVRVFGTGQPLPDEPTRHVGTVAVAPTFVFGPLVWHLREKIPAEPLPTEPEPGTEEDPAPAPTRADDAL